MTGPGGTLRRVEAWQPLFRRLRLSLLTMLLIALAAMLCSCGARRVSAAAARNAETVRRKVVPKFAGTAAPLASPQACRHLVPLGLNHPFTPAGRKLTVRDYAVVSCWAGTLAGKKFLLGTYFSSTAAGGAAVRYAGKLVAHLMVGSGPPAIVRFTGEDVCFAEQAGAYFSAVNIQTGARMDEKRAQDVCPPPVWPPAYVLGLNHRRYRINWSVQRQ